MQRARRGRRPPGRSRRSRPDGRRRCAARRCRWHRNGRWSGRPSTTSAASRIMPAQVPKAGIPSRKPLAERRSKPGRLEQQRHRRRLAAGQHQGVHLRPARPAVRTSAGVGAQLSERPDVLPDVALQGQHPDPSLAAGRGTWRDPSHAASVAGPGRSPATSPGRPGGSRRSRTPRRAWPRRGHGSPWPRSAGPCSGWWPRRWPGRSGPGPSS